MTIYDRIDKLLDLKKMSRRQLAIKADLKPSTLQSAMERKRNMPFDMLQSIATALGIQVEDIILGDEIDEYKQLCDTLAAAGFKVDHSDHPEGAYIDTYYIWRDGVEEEPTEIEHTRLVEIIHKVLADAEINKATYIKKRLDVELFGWVPKKEPKYRRGPNIPKLPKGE